MQSGSDGCFSVPSYVLMVSLGSVATNMQCVHAYYLLILSYMTYLLFTWYTYFHTRRQKVGKTEMNSTCLLETDWFNHGETKF